MINSTATSTAPVSTAKRTWLRLLVIWLAAFPAAVLVELVRPSHEGTLRNTLGAVVLLLIAYFLLGWIPVLVAFFTKKGQRL